MMSGGRPRRSPRLGGVGKQVLKKELEENKHHIEGDALTNTTIVKPSVTLKDRADLKIKLTHPHLPDIEDQIGGTSTSNFFAVYQAIRIMRAKFDAPVDTMGADQLGPQVHPVSATLRRM